MRLLIRPRPHAPTTFAASGRSCLPRWALWPYRAARLVWSAAAAFLHADTPGLVKLLVPLMAWKVWQSAGRGSPVELSLYAALGLVAFLKAALDVQAGRPLGGWRVTPWADDGPHYHREET